ncbi:hypothetical protein ACFY64_26085 [Streptomyces collinus]|uniref:hypothetical protein n=1 Tax=Streptomyces collinus TaxID=42684 RepID=UPI003696BD3E
MPEDTGGEDGQEQDLVPTVGAAAAGVLRFSEERDPAVLTQSVGTTAIHGDPPADAHHLFAERAAVLRRLAAWADEARTLADACFEGM